jgi:citrate synthase
MHIAIGLDGVAVAETQLSLVDGEHGRLIYRGYYAEDLATRYSFEEVAHLLWYGHLPSPEEAATLRSALQANRDLPPELCQIVAALPPEQDMMSVLRTAVSALAEPSPWPPSRAQAIRVTALIPTIIAYRQAITQGRQPITPDPSLSHVEHYLYLLQGRRPSPAHVRALEAYLVLTMEHGFNASTFAARVAASTQTDMAAALTAALAAMKGPLHGGAPAGVEDLLERIGLRENAEPVLRQALAAGELLMGFGHRAYRTRDPRAVALRQVVAELAGEDTWFDLAVHVEETAIRLLAEYKPGRRLYTNVEYWAAAVLRSLGIPKPLYTATFSVSRVVGWTAHILEQAENNRIIRPQAVYVGAHPDQG